MNLRNINEINGPVYFMSDDETRHSEGTLLHTMDDMLVYVTAVEGGYIGYVASEMDGEIFVKDHHKPVTKVMRSRRDCIEHIIKD